MSDIFKAANVNLLLIILSPCHYKLKKIGFVPPMNIVG